MTMCLLDDERAPVPQYARQCIVCLAVKGVHTAAYPVLMQVR